MRFAVLHCLAVSGLPQWVEEEWNIDDLTDYAEAIAKMGKKEPKKFTDKNVDQLFR